MSKTILITGGTGFAGSHLVEYLLSQTSDKIHVTASSKRPSYVSNLLPADHIHHLDLTQYQDTAELIRNVQPDYIYHLAAIAVVGTSYEQARTIIQNNLQLQLNILDAVKTEAPRARLLIVGSAQEYDTLEKPTSAPITEEHPLGPANPYGVSKVAQDLLGLSYFYSYNVDVVRVRPFNHIGERQTVEFAIANFAHQIVEIERGRKEATLSVGNLEAVRDFTDVKDVVRAYSILMEHGKTGEVYNVGSGVGTKVSQVLQSLLIASGTNLEVHNDPTRHRPLDVPAIIADTSKIAALGWQPSIPLEQTVQRILEYWRENS